MEERKLKAELEEQEKGKRLEIISVKKKSWELLRLCNDMIGEYEVGGKNEKCTEKVRTKRGMRKRN